MLAWHMAVIMNFERSQYLKKHWTNFG